jgi:hypothetical protein
MKKDILNSSTMTKAMYYVIQWTWGILMNIVGLGAFIIALFKHWEIDMYRNAVRITTNDPSYGGVSLGMFFVVGTKSDSLSQHEYGHTIQNLEWGILFPFVIGLPSLIRCAYLNKKYYDKNLKAPVEYDDAWFEGQATTYGRQAAEGKWNWL